MKGSNYKEKGSKDMWVALIIVALVIAIALDIKFKGLGYKMMPKSLQRLFHKD